MQKSYTKEELIEISPLCNCSPIIEITENNVVFEAEGDGLCQVQVSKDAKDWKLPNVDVYKLPCSVKLSGTKIMINNEYLYMRFVANPDSYFDSCVMAW